MKEQSRKDREKTECKHAGNRIKKLLGNKTQKDLADLLDLDESVISKGLSGDLPFHADEYIKIADFFGVTLDYLFGHDTNPDATICKTPKDICQALYSIYESPFRFSIDTSDYDTEHIAKFYFPLSDATDEDSDKYFSHYKWDSPESKRYVAAIQINNFLELMFDYTRRLHADREEPIDHKIIIKAALDKINDGILDYPAGFYAPEQDNK